MAPCDIVAFCVKVAAKAASARSFLRMTKARRAVPRLRALTGSAASVTCLVRIGTGVVVAVLGRNEAPKAHVNHDSFPKLLASDTRTIYQAHGHGLSVQTELATSAAHGKQALFIHLKHYCAGNPQASPTGEVRR